MFLENKVKQENNENKIQDNDYLRRHVIGVGHIGVSKILEIFLYLTDDTNILLYELNIYQKNFNSHPRTFLINF